MIIAKLLAAAIITAASLLFGLALLAIPLTTPETAQTQLEQPPIAPIINIEDVDLANVSQTALADIPPLMLSLYIKAASACTNLPWTVIAGIGKIESNHGRYRGATLQPNGQITPPIIGIPLDGRNNTLRILDTDNGRHDGDTTYDRAVGPFQFIPTSWTIYGTDGNGDGHNDPNNAHDAIPAAVNHLCPNGTITNINSAVFSYNRSRKYVNDVLSWAGRYDRHVR